MTRTTITSNIGGTSLLQGRGHRLQQTPKELGSTKKGTQTTKKPIELFAPIRKRQKENEHQFRVNYLQEKG